MDFFSNQDSARRNTKYLVLLYVVAVCLLIGLANGLIAFSLWLLSSDTSAYGTPTLTAFFSWHMLGKVSLGVTAIVFCAVVFKWLLIGSGGKAVAESLGGTRISPGTDKPDQRRVLNVVEEMALASGMPVPPVYLLDKEQGINAFAAGNTPADAVIGVTQGSLDQFNREQLQGVIAHEFSHILNGDMRLNLRLIALLNGIVFIGGFGHFLMRSSWYTSGSSRRRFGSFRLVLVGLAMAAIGWLGTFFGGIIKAAINRQREFLADASAVQFTRNPAGIADALKIIGGYSSGSKVLSAAAEEASHMFIGNALGSYALFDTHPPLTERIRRLERGWDGEMIVRQLRPKAAASGADPANSARSGRAAAAATGLILAGALGGQTNQGNTTGELGSSELPNSIIDNLADPFSAKAIVYALVLDEKADIRAAQLNSIRAHGAQGSSQLASQMFRNVQSIDPAWRMVVIEKAMPALKCMSIDQYKTFRKVLLLLIRADEKIELFEWCIFQIIRHYLGAEFGDRRPSKPRYKTIGDVAQAYTLVLSVFVHHGHMEPKTAERAFTRGANSAGLYNASLLPESQCKMGGFTKGAEMLADCYPLLKARLLKGLADTAKFDRTISAMEKELITSVAAVMDSPIPRLQI